MYDKRTGQVLREWTIPQSTTDGHQSWCHRCPYPQAKFQNQRGPRPLIDMAMDVVVTNSGCLTEKHLREIPNALLLKLWRILVARGMCFHSWKLVSSALLAQKKHISESLALFRFRQTIQQPNQPLAFYTKPLTSPSVEFITHLKIAGDCGVSTHELLCLAEMRNLGVLEIIQPREGANLLNINDRLLRGWSNISHAFPLLRILRIFACRQGITEDSLSLVSKFPSLAMYEVMGWTSDWKNERKCALKAKWAMVKTKRMNWFPMSLPRGYMTLIAHDLNIRRNNGNSHVNTADLEDCRLWSLRSVNANQHAQLLDDLIKGANCQFSETEQNSHPYLEINKAARTTPEDEDDDAIDSLAFWMYSAVGQIANNADFSRQGLACELQAAFGPMVMPARPMASLVLGEYNHKEVNIGGLLRHHLFFRSDTDMEEPLPIGSMTNAESSADKKHLRKKKRPVEEMLFSLS